MKEVLFVMYFATVGGVTQATTSMTAEFQNRESCDSAGRGHLKIGDNIGNNQKVLVFYMCSPLDINTAKKPTPTKADQVTKAEKR